MRQVKLLLTGHESQGVIVTEKSISFLNRGGELPVLDKFIGVKCTSKQGC